MKQTLLLLTGIIIVTGLAAHNANSFFSPPKAVAGDTATALSLGTYRVTAYCLCPKCCGKWSDGRTANNHLIMDGERFCAAPSSIPFGTMLIIEGYGKAEVLDRDSAIKGKRLDVYFDTHQEALNWGVKYIEIFERLEREEK